MTMAFSLSAFGQERVRLDADEVGSFLMRKTKQEVAEYLKGAEHRTVEYSSSDIYYIYSERDKQNIPLKFDYIRYEEGDSLRVYHVEYISRKSKHYKPADLKTAFWLEYLKNPK